MVFKELIERTTLANIVAAFLVVTGMLFFMDIVNEDAVLFLAGAGVGWLLKEVKK